jgi:GNAT superfamily N-acetyltransferase
MNRDRSLSGERGAPSMRRYQPSDLAECAALMRSNIPKSFLPGDLATFTTWLTSTTDPFFICAIAGQIVACGGYSLVLPAQAWLRWGIVAREHHRRGIGSYLLTRRLHEMRRGTHSVGEVRVETSQHSYGFFVRHGFKVESWRSDAFGPGHDRVEMALRLP